MTVSTFAVPQVLADEVSIMHGNDYYSVYSHEEDPFRTVNRGWCVWTVYLNDIEAAADWYYMTEARWDQMNDDGHTAHDAWKRRVTSKERRARYAEIINDTLKTVRQLLVEHGATEYMLSGEALEEKRRAGYQRRYPSPK